MGQRDIREERGARGNCLLALSRYVNVVKERCGRYQGMLREKVSMENVVTRVERVRVEFIFVV